ncbi:YlmG protein 2, chloroplastic [Ananas comosus]|uniref:YlmG protein 2, chloroplastic n=1 Tax=Ananas comosus TaxID=4615 RepID=A0A199VVS2_ANACO|nr:YlmG protein 2, chloroplastic [Ananas comosus]
MAPLPHHDAPRTTTTNTTIPHFSFLVSFPFLRLPFASPTHHQPSSKPLVPDPTAPNTLPSLLSSAELRLKELASALSDHPLLKPLLSFHSHLRSFSQIHCRGARNPKLLSDHGFAAVLPGDSVAGLVVANGIMNFLNIYNTLLVVRLVLTWFPNSPPAIVNPLSTLCDPYLNIFRGLIPPLGGALDLSPILAFLVLNVFTSTAAALPAELPSTTPSQRSTSHLMPLNLTAAQRKWMQRVSSKKSK